MLNLTIKKCGTQAGLLILIDPNADLKGSASNLAITGSEKSAKSSPQNAK